MATTVVIVLLSGLAHSNSWNTYPGVSCLPADIIIAEYVDRLSTTVMYAKPSATLSVWAECPIVTINDRYTSSGTARYSPGSSNGSAHDIIVTIEQVGGLPTSCSLKRGYYASALYEENKGGGTVTTVGRIDLGYDIDSLFLTPSGWFFHYVASCSVNGGNGIAAIRARY